MRTLRLATLVAVASAAASAPVSAEFAPSAPVYSLVIARAQIRTRSAVPLDCGDAVCIDSAYGASFDHVRTLAGPTIEEPLGALLVSHMPQRDVPALLIVETLPDKSKKESFWTRDGSSRPHHLCIGGSAFSDLGWHPVGPGVEREDDVVCADMTEIMALPSSLSEAVPLRVLGPREARRHMRRQKH